MSAPLDLIARRFRNNVLRVKSLNSIFVTTLSRSNIAASRRQDVLRASVVLMHASLEDVIREALRYKSPTGVASFTRNLRFEYNDENQSSPDKVTIHDLCRYKDKTVNELIEESVSRHLDRRTFNNTRQISAALEQLGLSVGDFETYYTLLTKCIERRHIIVHRSDRESRGDDDHGRLAGIGSEEVEGWLEAVDGFGSLLLTKLGFSRRFKIIRKNSN